ncbi:MAG: PhzF family phenazine biosynthesis protein [Bacteroidetes bacterium]|nr:PhzF family phenazine biosynthesis protein [Bacteroidota bacterium]
MKLKIFIVNAFAETKFGGNPAAVVPLREWLSENLMQDIAAQNNLAETAFIVPRGEEFAIRWFTPAVEVALCGHATLASAHVYFTQLGYAKEKITFHSKSGPLHVTQSDDGKLTLDFPADTLNDAAVIPAIENGLKIKPLEVYKGSTDYMVVLQDQNTIEQLSPDFKILSQLPSRGIIATAKGDSVDFVSRCFFPQSGIDEDPVTGSAHTVMAPYWTKRLGKEKLSAIQLSKRKGYLECEMIGGRVLISGNAHIYLEGEIFI